MTIMQNKIEEIQMGNRKSNIEIKNVPKKNNETKEDQIDIVVNLSQNIGCKVDKIEIKDINRVRGKKSEKLNTPIVVETGSTIIKTEILKIGKAFNIKIKSKLYAKHLGFKVQEATSTFLSEQLTLKGSHLHLLARDLVKSKARRPPT